MREIKIDKAIYLVDDKLKIYFFKCRNFDWKKLNKEENESNKKVLRVIQENYETEK